MDTLPTLKAASDTYQGHFDIGVPPQRKEIYGSEEKMEHSIAPVLTEAQEAKLWRKIDLWLMPMIALMYLFSFMDRGNAKLDGLMTQLNLTGNKYNIALTMYFIPYSLFEFPSNLVIQVIRPSRQVYLTHGGVID
ncbi:hypothetical protein PAXRUDRAFT_150882 [Paxillus rubicundulus Ve08.2h10]|uniref:Uncharacterized protein n=1 Tax=Paxillus rubicundulus Ve08.2h10 TaxID=930991 RepID=A0A0D0DS95_9AGAM|nr:hypothetical protein PAXRUDRAFT_150882 [Paxillus rubicundulus Ve08.2h10]